MEQLIENTKKIINFFRHQNATSIQELEKAAEHFGVDVYVLTRSDFLKNLNKFPTGTRIIANIVDQGMGHWAAVYLKTKKDRYMFCSDGYDFNSLFVDSKNAKRTTSVLQRDGQNLCGHLALAWLMMTKKRNKDWMFV